MNRTQVIGTLSNSPYYYALNQTGGDGKFEILPSGIRVKWNNYHKTVYEEFLTPTTGFGFWSMYGDGVPLNAYSSSRGVALDSKLVSRIKDHDFNLAVAVGEGSQTVKLVTSTLSTFYRAMRDLKRGNNVSAIRRFAWNSGHRAPTKLTGRTIAQRWLELQYGWKPLLSDCYESARAFEKLSNQPRTMTLRVSNFTEAQKNISQAPSNYELMLKYHASKSIIYEMSENISVQRSLGLSDPLSLVWELLPFSFVADWFIPIGTYLENLNTIPNLKGRFCTTVYCRAEGYSRFVGTPAVFPSYNGASAHTKTLYIDRVITNKMAAILPSFKSLPDAMSPLHIANGIALLRSFH